MSQHVVRLLRGDKRNPSRTLDLAEGISTGNIFLRSGGLSPSGGPTTVTWSGRSSRRDGQKRITSSIDNAEFSLTYDLRSNTSAGLGGLQRKISRFFLEAKLREEDAQGEDIWLEYRWQEGLDALPAPVFGQFSYYMKVLEARVPAWPGSLHTGALVAGDIEGVVAELTCEPTAEGVKQQAGLSKGHMKLTNNGVIVARNITNYSTNPSFGHATWNNGWSVSDADLNIINETRADFVRSLDSGAHLVNISASAQTFTQSMTIGSGPWVVSCYVRTSDGSAPTSSDMQIVVDSAAKTTTFIQIDDSNWYLAYANDSAAGGARLYGVQVKAGREVWIDDVQIELRSTLESPTPFCAGYILGCAWASTAHASNSTSGASSLIWVFNDEVSGEFTVAGWFTPLWGDDDAVTDLDVVKYSVDANNNWTLNFDFVNDRFEIVGDRDGVAFSGNGSARSFDYGDHLHFVIRQDKTRIRGYINGSEDISISNAVGMPVGGNFQLGSAANAVLDGWHVWRQVLTVTQIVALYNSEHSVKHIYESVGIPPLFWTKDGDGILDNVDDTNRDNWGVVGGVVGDVEARVEWHITPPTATPSIVYWLGRKAAREQLNPSFFWLELQGTGDGSSSGGEYEGIAAGTSDFLLGDGAGDVQSGYYNKFFPGRYQYLSRFYVLTNTVAVQPAFSLGSTTVARGVYLGDAVTVAADGSFVFVDFGDLVVRYPGDVSEKAHRMIFIDRTATATVRGDFVMLLPHPCFRIESIDGTLTIAVSEKIVVLDDTAYTLASTGDKDYFFEYRGPPVTLVPDQYNYVWLLQGQESFPYDITDTATLEVFITPRWLLPGGPVA